MKSFAELKESLNPDLDQYNIKIGHLNSRVKVEPANNPVYGKYQLGHLKTKQNQAWGQTILIDLNHDFDVKWCGTKFVARLENPLTKVKSNGVLEYASIAKFDLKAGMIYYVDNEHYEATDELKWERPIKFTQLIIQNVELAKKIGWL